MKLVLHNFMKHEHLELEIEPGKTTLISGESEQGKSSILCAIAWCLYGKMQKVHRGDSGKVYVSITLLDLTITRQARPGRLKVTVAGKESFLADTAQGIINSKFGTYEKWTACSYIEQKKMCHLLEASYSDRMKILSSLAFDDENPDKHIKKIEEVREKIRKEYEKALLDYNVKNGIFQDKYSSYTEPVGVDGPVEERIRLKSQIEILTSTLNTAREALRKNEELKARKNVLESQLSKISNEIASIGVIPTEEEIKETHAVLEKKEIVMKDVSSLESKINTFKALKRQETTLLAKLNSVEPIPEEFLTTKFYHDVQTQEKKYQNGSRITKQLEIAYERSVIDKMIENYTKQMNEYKQFSPQVGMVERLDKLKASFETMSVPDNILDEDIQKEKRILDMMRQTRNLLKCPHCGNHVRYNGGSLISSEQIPASLDEIKEQEQKISILTQKHGFQLQYDQLEKQIKELSSAIKDLEGTRVFMTKKVDPNFLLQVINVLGKIEVVTAPKYSSINIKYSIELRDLRQRLGELGPVDINYDGSDDRRLLRECKLKYETIKNKLNSHTALKQRETEIILSLTAINVVAGLEEQISTLEEEIEKTKTRVKEMEVYEHYLKDRQVFDAIKADSDRLKRELDSIHTIHEKAVNLSCSLLEDTIESVNIIMNPILENIFDKSVLLELNLFKHLKVGNKVKQQVNLDVFFEAKKYEKRFCGGEQDRISMAMLIALNKLSASPFILMDEVLGTVSSRIASKCIKELKSNLDENKYIICIEHNSIEGRYDKVIHL